MRPACARLLGLVVLVLLAPSLGVALEWNEVGDAGELPGTAQETDGTPGDPLDAINGTFSTDTDQDMYSILINDPANFSASTNNAGTNLSADNDTLLFLFDLGGFGSLGNDDVTEDEILQSIIPSGSFSGPAGVYLLAVSIFDNQPQSADGLIWDLEAFIAGFAVAPTGPGMDLPISGWDLSPDPSQTGPYRIELTGAAFVPEPTTALLLATGLAGLALWGSRLQRA